jgi:putative hydrolase
MLHDFHTHTCMSDGALSPLELVRRALVKGYKAIAITDHAGVGYLDRLIAEVTRDCVLAQRHWDITAIPGVELTHLPAEAIPSAAEAAKAAGAKLVVVHGETTAEPVEPGTNLAAAGCPHVDILAHPGLITPEEAELAAASDVYLEITSRRMHSATNEHVARVARLTGAKLLINSDSHDEQDLLDGELARSIARSAGMTDEEIENALYKNPVALLNRLARR